MNQEYKFIITEDIYKQCLDFADNSIATHTNKYAKRNQSNPEKIKKDIMYGKIGEMGVHHIVSQTYPHLTVPDLQIYAKKDKNWSADLKDAASDFKLAVKSQNIDSDIAYGRSWVFQYGNGKFDCDTGIFGQDIDPNHYVALVSLNFPKREGIIRAIVQVKWLHEQQLFKEMKLQHLRNNKKAVYWEDLEQHSQELFQYIQK